MRLMTALLTLAFFAWAPHALAGPDRYPMEPTAIVKGPPGEVTFDATEGKMLFPLPREIRAFGSNADYYSFLEKELNAKLLYNKNGEVESYNLAVTYLGPAHYYDYARNVFVDVANPRTAFIGGLSGQILVAGKLRCVNPETCLPDKLLPPTLELAMYARGDIEIAGEITERPTCDDPDNDWWDCTNQSMGVFRQWTVEFSKPDAQKLLEQMLGYPPCEFCLKLPNGESCLVPSYCPGYPTDFLLEVTPAGYLHQDGKWLPWSRPTVRTRNMATSVAYEEKFIRWDEATDPPCRYAYGLANSFAPFVDSASVTTKDGYCP